MNASEEPSINTFAVNVTEFPIGVKTEMIDMYCSKQEVDDENIIINNLNVVPLLLDPLEIKPEPPDIEHVNLPFLISDEVDIKEEPTLGVPQALDKWNSLVEDIYRTYNALGTCITAEDDVANDRDRDESGQPQYLRKSTKPMKSPGLNAILPNAAPKLTMPNLAWNFHVFKEKVAVVHINENLQMDKSVTIFKKKSPPQFKCRGIIVAEIDGKPIPIPTTVEEMNRLLKVIDKVKVCGGTGRESKPFSGICSGATKGWHRRCSACLAQMQKL